MKGGPELRAKKVTVVGLAATGVATANFLGRAGAKVTVSETLPPDMVEAQMGHLDKGVGVEAGGHRINSFTGADLIVPSPGVPRDLPFLSAAKERGVPIWSEVELASRFIRRPILAVTGTNGKSTTVSLLGAMLTAGGLRAPVAGNIGTPLIEMAGRDAEYDCLAVEISSFQLEWVETFAPRSAAVLNVTDDHLDRYHDFEDYLETKLRITSFQGPGDSLVLNGDDPALQSHWPTTRARVLRFSHKPVARGVWRKDHMIMSDLGGEGRPMEILDAGTLAIVGVHNMENVMAAAAMALDFGVPTAAVAGAAQEFKSLPHRNELVADLNGVRYFDDSKGTNVGAVIKSLESFSGPIILIAGGREKGGSYLPLADEVSRKVRLLVVIGEARERMTRELGGVAETVAAGSLEDAVRLAAERSRPGDVVLLSPACSSFDMFRDYHHRGQVFRDAVRSLTCRAR